MPVGTAYANEQNNLGIGTRHCYARRVGRYELCPGYEPQRCASQPAYSRCNFLICKSCPRFVQATIILPDTKADAINRSLPTQFSTSCQQFADAFFSDREAFALFLDNLRFGSSDECLVAQFALDTGDILP